MSYSALPYFSPSEPSERDLYYTNCGWISENRSSHKQSEAVNKERGFWMLGFDKKTDISTWPISCLSRKHQAEEITWNGELIQRRVCWGVEAWCREWTSKTTPSCCLWSELTQPLCGKVPPSKQRRASTERTHSSETLLYAEIIQYNAGVHNPWHPPYNITQVASC